VADWTHGSDETENLLAHVQGAHSGNPAEHLLTYWPEDAYSAERNVADWTHGSDATETLLAHVHWQGAHSENPAEHLLE
jgi:hypothetical protein